MHARMAVARGACMQAACASTHQHARLAAGEQRRQLPLRRRVRRERDRDKAARVAGGHDCAALVAGLARGGEQR